MYLKASKHKSTLQYKTNKNELSKSIKRIDLIFKYSKKYKELTI